MTFLAIAALLCLNTACDTAAPNRLEEGETGDYLPTDASEQIDDAPSGLQANESIQAIVSSVCSVRREPHKDKWVEGVDKSGKTTKVRNWVATVHRGEAVQVKTTQAAQSWSQVVLSDDVEGWIESKFLVESEGLTIAAATEDVQTYVRPDMLTLNTKKNIVAGSLVFILREKDEFAEVNMPASHFSSTTAWVVKNKLSVEPQEVLASRLMSKWRYLTEKEQEEEAMNLAQLIKSEFKGTKISKLLIGFSEVTDALEAQPLLPQRDANTENDAL